MKIVICFENFFKLKSTRSITYVCEIALSASSINPGAYFVKIYPEYLEFQPSKQHKRFKFLINFLRFDPSFNNHL